MAEGSARIRAGRYTLHGEIASGGMATVHYGQMVGAHGFSRVVAIKRMLPRLARDPRFHEMFVEEARLASRVQHPNVVPILDVLDEDGEIMIVMDYVNGAALSTLQKGGVEAGSPVPVAVVANIGCAMLAGLHAAHEARDRGGRPLGIVHRDVSPQNVLVGVDGVTRIMDFGIAKATHLERDDRQLTGKLCYMAPEQFRGEAVDRRTDVFATAVVLWGALAGRRLFRGNDVNHTIEQVRRCEVPSLSEFRDDFSPELQSALGRALDPDPAERYATAEEFAGAIEAATSLATTRTVADWVKQLVGPVIAERDRVIVHIEKTRTTMSVSVPDGTLSDIPTAEWERSPTPAPELAEPARPSLGRRERVGLVAIGGGLLVSLIAGVLLFRTREATPSVVPAPSASEVASISPRLETKPVPSPRSSPSAPPSVSKAPMTRPRVSPAKPAKKPGTSVPPPLYPTGL
jgi:serine/threonine protein kinase